MVKIYRKDSIASYTRPPSLPSFVQCRSLYVQLPSGDVQQIPSRGYGRGRGRRPPPPSRSGHVTVTGTIPSPPIDVRSGHRLSFAVRSPPRPPGQPPSSIQQNYLKREWAKEIGIACHYCLLFTPHRPHMHCHAAFSPGLHAITYHYTILSLSFSLSSLFTFYAW